MKNSFLLLLTMTMTLNSRAQINVNASLDEVYRDFLMQSHAQFTKSISDDFLSKGGDRRFFYHNWLIGGVTNNFGITISGNYYFNFDFVEHDLYAKWKDSVIVVNGNYIKSFFILNNNRIHTFVKCRAINEPGTLFFESLTNNEEDSIGKKIQFLKLRTVKRVKSKKDDYFANFSGDYSDSYDNDISYFIVFPDNSFMKIKLNRKSLIAALVKHYPTVSEKLVNEAREINEDSVALIIKKLNSY